MRFLVPLHKFSSICRKTQISTFISLTKKQSEAGKNQPRFSVLSLLKLFYTAIILV